MIEKGAAVAVLLFAMSAAAEAAPIVREAGAIYLEDFTAPRIRLQVLRSAPATFDLAGARPVGELLPGQAVELVAVAGDLFRVRGRAAQGPVIGWVVSGNLSPLNPDFLAALEMAEQRRVAVERLIRDKEVAVGMTRAEVEQSLGKPQKRARRSEAGAPDREVWEFIAYKTVPQQTVGRDMFGNPVVSTLYVRQPVGRLAVEFEHGIAVAVEEAEDREAARVRIIPAPIILR